MPALCHSTPLGVMLLLTFLSMSYELVDIQPSLNHFCVEFFSIYSSLLTPTSLKMLSLEYQLSLL